MQVSDTSIHKDNHSSLVSYPKEHKHGHDTGHNNFIYIYIYNVYLSQKKQQISPFYRPIRGKGMTRERFLRSAVAMSMDEN